MYEIYFIFHTFNRILESNGADGAYGNSGTVRGCSYDGNVVGYGGSTVVYNSNYGSAWQGAPQRWVNNNPSWGNQRGGSGASLQRPCKL